MRVLVLGGTGFVGGACVADLVHAGHDVMVVHRGLTEPADEPTAIHLHVARNELAGAAQRLRDFAPDTLIDVAPMTRQDAEAVLGVLDPAWQLVALSSMDVYRAYDGFRSGRSTDRVPMDETAPVREERYPYRSEGDLSYDKLDVEDTYLPRGAVVLRLPMVYGPADPQRREEFILRRVRAGRLRIPCGSGGLRWSRGSVDDIARAVRLAVELDPPLSGRVFNVCEPAEFTGSIRSWARGILDAASSPAELVEVPDELLPPDLGLTKTFAQDLLFDAARAQQELGWEASNPADAVARSVAWHLRHPPVEPGPDLSGDDRALEAADAV